MKVIKDVNCLSGENEITWNPSLGYTRPLEDREKMVISCRLVVN